MKAITIHNIDDQLAQRITAKAEAWSLSQNKTVKKILAEALGMNQQKTTQDFSEFCGVWSDQEHAEFTRNTKQFSNIDTLEWS